MSFITKHDINQLEYLGSTLLLKFNDVQYTLAEEASMETADQRAPEEPVLTGARDHTTPMKKPTAATKAKGRVSAVKGIFCK